MKKIFTYHTLNNLNLEASYYPTPHESKGLILYFHGGGLIYGHRDDLPIEYINSFNEVGYSFLTLDYPLVPEIRIDTIFNCLEEGIENLANEKILENENLDELIYFGRSAGAFLALQLASSKKLKTPKKIISFYGYYSLESPLLNEASSHYKTYDLVPFMTTYSLIKKEPVANAKIEERFQIYLSYRQTGTWVKELLGRKNKAADYSLSEEELAEFPPTFIAASSADNDVPFEINEKLAKLIPNSETFFVDGLPHDFDATPKGKASIECYSQLIEWLN